MPTIRREAEHSAHHVIVIAREESIGDANLGIRKWFFEKRVLHFDADTARRSGEQVRKRLQREREPRKLRARLFARRGETGAQCGEVRVDLRVGVRLGREAANEDFAKLLTVQLEKRPKRRIRRIAVAVLRCTVREEA